MGEGVMGEGVRVSVVMVGGGREHGPGASHRDSGETACTVRGESNV